MLEKAYFMYGFSFAYSDECEGKGAGGFGARRNLC